MRMRFWASFLFIAALSGAAPQGEISLPSGVSLSYSNSAGKTRFEIRTKSGHRYTTKVDRDSTVSKKASPVKVEVIGEIPDKALIVTDTYPSVPLGMSYCQAGEERFLRVLTIENGVARETLKVKLASCRDNIELADPGLEWDAKTATLRVHWLEGPSTKGKAEERSIHIDAGGRPK